MTRFLPKPLRRFFADYSRTRIPRHLLQGLPALMFGASFICAIVLSLSQSQSDLGIKYRRAARQHMRAAQRALHLENLPQAEKNWRAADVFYRKVVKGPETDPDALWDSALLAEKMKRPSRRDAMIRRLKEEFAYPSAYLYSARQRIHSKERNLQGLEKAQSDVEKALATAAHPITEEERIDFEKRVDHVRRQLGAAFSDLGYHARAIEQFENLFDPNIASRSEKANIFHRAGKLEEASTIARSTLQEISSAATLEAALFRATAMAILDEGDAAIALLRQLRPAAADEKVAPLVASISLQCFEILKRTHPENPRLELVETTLEVLPTHPLLPKLLVKLAGLDPETVEPMPLDRARRLVAKGTAPVAAHLCAGLVALRIGNREEAEFHLSMAHRSRDSVADILGECSLSVASQSDELKAIAHKLSRLLTE